MSDSKGEEEEVLSESKKPPSGAKALGMALRQRIDTQRKRDTRIHRARARTKTFLSNSTDRAQRFGVTVRKYQTGFDNLRKDPGKFTSKLTSDAKSAFEKRNPMHRNRNEITSR
jgi:hypothetical protein